jgi:uncharacterized protein YbbK (DUF523 family)
MGQRCRYDGECAKDEARAGLAAALAALGPRELIAFCPEEAGGLPTPRPPAWIEAQNAAAVLAGGARLVTEAGDDVTVAFVAGAKATLELARARGVEHALLKEHSPSCGVASTSVGAERRPGPGVTAQLLLDAGLSVKGV